MRLIDIAGILFIQVIWGFHIAISKIGLHEFPPLLLMGVRFTIVAALLCPFFRLPKGKLRQIAALSLTFGSLSFGLMYAGVAHLDASTSAIVGQAQVPFAAILAAYFYKDRFSGWQMVGLGLSFLGIVLIAGEPRVGANLIWVLSILASTLATATAYIQIKALGAVNSFALSGWVAFFTAPQLLLCSLFLEDGQWQAIRNATWRGWSSLSYTVFVIAIGSYYLWYPLLRRYPVNQVMPFTLLVPVFGVIAGMLLLGETLNIQMFLGAVATIAGVAVILLHRAQAAAAATPTTQKSL